MENWWNDIEKVKHRYKPVPVPLCPPHIPHGLFCGRTQAPVVKSQ